MVPLLRTVFGVMLGGLLARLAEMTSRLHGSAHETQKYARRGFIRNATLGSSLVITAIITGGFVRFFWPNKTGAFGKVLTVPGTSVPEVNGAPFAYPAGKFYLVNTDAGVMALYWRCPHLGCTVPWAANEDQFHCPCHGSIYDYTGAWIGGPAPRSMDYMTLTFASNGDVLVDTGDIQTRASFDPSQAVPIPA